MKTQLKLNLYTTDKSAQNFSLYKLLEYINETCLTLHKFNIVTTFFYGDESIL